jgi:putative endonuclease
MKASSGWFVYIAQCNDGSFYTGVTTDLMQRLSQHNGQIRGGAKSLRGKRPVVLVYSEPHTTRSAAQIREATIKKLSHKEKIDLIG